MSEPNKEGTIKFITALKYFGSFVFLLTILGIGYAISSGFWSSAVTNLQIDLRRAQEELSNTRAELAQVKAEYANYIARIPGIPIEQRVGQLSVKDNVKILPTPMTKQEIPFEKSGMESVTVTTGQTKGVFGNALTISLIATPFGGDPLRHRVTATIGAVGYKNVSFKNEDVGYSVQYQGKGLYEIRVTSADTFNAGFMVSKIK